MLHKEGTTEPNLQDIHSIYQVEMLSVALPIAFLIASATAQNTEYEYVVIGSGPGGGPLAYVQLSVKNA
jgi:hypothetical protein